MELSVIHHKIFTLREQRVMLDFDLALLFDVETRTLKQAVKRNMDRFPEDFMFELRREEWKELITNCDSLSATVKFSPALPFAFTEHGVAMLSSVLRSRKAVQMNILIMRAFIELRNYTLTHKELVDKIKGLEARYDKQFKDIYEALNYLIQEKQNEVKPAKRQRIGFKKEEE